MNYFFDDDKYLIMKCCKCGCCSVWIRSDNCYYEIARTENLAEAFAAYKQIVGVDSSRYLERIG